MESTSIKKCLYSVLFILALAGFSISLYLAWTSFPEPASTSAALGAAATIVIASLTLVLAVETWALRKLQNQQILAARLEGVKPLVAVSLEEGYNINDRNFVVRNVGKGIAYDLSFELKKGGREPEIEKEIADTLSDHGFFNNGMRFLGIGQSIESHIFMFHDFGGKGDIFEPLFHISVTYKDSFGHNHENSFTFDFREYKRIERIGEKPEREIANNLKGISSNLSRILSGFQNGIRVNAYGRTERKEERDRWQQELKERRECISTHRKTD